METAAETDIPAPGKLSFVKYTSIENHYLQDPINVFRIEGHTQGEWVGTEKDGVKVKCAKRSGPISPGENFFNHETVLEANEEKVLKLFKMLSAQYEDITSIAVYGEIFGGMYPHERVQADPSVKLPVQRGVWYSPNILFYAFDIKLFPKGGFLPYDEMSRYFEVCGFFYSKALVRGSFQQVMDFDVETLVTTIPRELGLPEIANNFAEGIVLKPVAGGRTQKNERVILKKKHPDFRENVEGPNASNTKKRKPKATKPAPVLPDSVTRLSAEIIRYININRLRGLVSKMGIPKAGHRTFNEYTAAFAKDVIEDFVKENPDYSQLDKNLQKKITGYMNGVLINFLRNHWDDTIAGKL